MKQDFIDEQTINSENTSFAVEQEEDTLLNFINLFSIFVINWKWFVISIALFVGGAYAYLKYTTPVYQAQAKVLIKDESGGGRSRRSLLYSENLGMMSNSQGIDNEMEIIASRTIALDVVKKLKLHTSYTLKGKIVDKDLYRIQPVSVDLDENGLENLNDPVSLSMTFQNRQYHVKGTCFGKDKNGMYRQFGINTSIKNLPSTIKTAAGSLTFSLNPERKRMMSDGDEIFVRIIPAENTASMYASRLAVTPTSKMTTILMLTYTDINIQRSLDYLQQLVTSYNNEANNDKNIVAVRTEEFINNRLEKINMELGATEGQLESFKKKNNVVELSLKAGNAFTQSNTFEGKLAEMATQEALLKSISDYMELPQNKYQTLPSNVGLTDEAASSLIDAYNKIVLERNRLLRTANANSPTVIPLTEQLNDLTASIKRAMAQTRNNYEITRRGMLGQYSKYNAQVQESPTQERILNEIGRQQEVRSGLYLMLLQKREENSISLAATADKGKLIDKPAYTGQIAPKRNKILAGAFGVGLAIPLVILLIIQFMRYKIEGRNDVERLTRLPIIADIPVASNTAKKRADIVVQENQNNMMEEVFRSLRTNLQFTLKDDEKIIMLTSNSSGEGKTFIAANLAVSFALLGKRVLLAGLDIRKPRLSSLFGIETDTGITRILIHDEPTEEMVREQIIPSGINRNLDLLMSGPIPPNPAELLARQSLDVIFERLKDIYDYIIIDTAPVGLVTDTITIGRVTDATVYVSRADYTPKSAFAYINELADTRKLPNVSVVINGIDLSMHKYGYYYGYGKYGKYAKYASYKSYGSYGKAGSYGMYGHYGDYSMSHYSNQEDDSYKK